MLCFWENETHFVAMYTFAQLRKSIEAKKAAVAKLLQPSADDKAAESRRNAAVAMEKKAMDLLQKARDAELAADAASDTAAKDFHASALGLGGGEGGEGGEAGAEAEAAK
jgi:hypothetical protein